MGRYETTPPTAGEMTVAEPTALPKDISDMSDRELLEECVRNMRMVMEVVEALEHHPMVQAIGSGQNPLMAMMGR